ncbi:Fe-S protein assembly co-chaperone HscB [Acidobacteria bacterium AB60]|nr:Fe-S protein assembly co-chaperone HscB [Acidobacteria bacterium AB60]
MLNVLDSAVPVECWSCSVAHNESTLFCPHCSKIQPPPGGNYYSVFNLQPALNIDLAALETAFHRLSRKLHPDRFARATASEKEWSLADTALLNDAYRTLRDPLRRTEYLLKLHGAEIGEEHSGKDRRPHEMGASRAPADLLEEVFELNMQLEEMRAARSSGEDDPALARNLSEAKAKFEGLQAEVDHDLREQWTAWDNGGDAEKQAAQKAMVALLDRRRYLSNLVREVNETMGA